MHGTARTLLLAVALAAACDGPDPLPETPRLEVSAPRLSFTAPDGGYDPPAQQVAVTSVGGPLEVTGVSAAYASGSGWLSVDVVDAAAWPVVVTVRPRVAGLRSGRHEATVFVSATGVVNSPFPVHVAVDVPPPRMVASAYDVWFWMPGAELPPPFEVALANAGGGTLARPTVDVEYVGAGDWLSVEVTGSDPYSLVLRPVAEAIVETFNFAALTIRTPDAAVAAVWGSDEITIYVSLSVNPTLEVSTGVVRFEHVPGEAPPGARIVTATPSVLPEIFGAPTVELDPWPSSGEGCEGWLEVTVADGGPPYTVTVTPVPAVVANAPAAGCVTRVFLDSHFGGGNTMGVFFASLSVVDSRSVPLVEPSTRWLSFYAFAGGEDPPPQSFTVVDALGGTLPRPAVSASHPWITATVSEQPPWTVSVRPRVAPPPPGWYEDAQYHGALSVAGYSVPVYLHLPRWRVLGWNVASPLAGHTATALRDGRVLLVGEDTAIDPESCFQLYDPSADAHPWELGPAPFPSSEAQGFLASSRAGHTATALGDGRVIAAGGVTPCCRGAVVCACGGAVGSWEIFDPATGTWRVSRPLATPRFGHTATALADGRVLLAGGATGTKDAPVAIAGTELLDPASGTSAVTGALSTPRRRASAVRLADDKVLVAGGLGADGAALGTAELFDPALGTWSATGAMRDARSDAALVLLEDGRALVAGGDGGGAALASAEIYDPASGTWAQAAPMQSARVAPGVRLPSGRVLLVAGATGDLTTVTGAAEQFDPDTGLWSSAGALEWPRSGHAVTVLPSGAVFVSGGGTTLSSEEGGRDLPPSADDAGVCCGVREFEIGGMIP